MIRISIQVALLAAVYVVVVGSAQPGDVAVGGAVAIVLVAVYRRRLWDPVPRRERDTLRRALAFFPFVGVAAAHVMRGAYDTAVVVLGLRETTPGIVCVPVDDRSAAGAAITAALVSLSPGTVLIDADTENEQMLFHIIDAGDPDGFREEQRRFYEKYQKKVFP